MAEMVDVPRAEWRGFFDRMSKGLGGRWAEIEVAALDLGDQIVAEWVPIIGITYDDRDDILDVALDRTDHLIHHPQAISVDSTVRGVNSIAVVDAEGERQVIRLKEPLTLPPQTR